jgi:multidrug efflux pump subunit AcrA (membrane-fusion protein)
MREWLLATSGQQETAATGKPAAPAKRLFAEVAALAGECSSRLQFFSRVLRTVTTALSSPYAAIHVRYGAEVLQDDFHVGRTHPRFWKDSLQAFLTEALGQRSATAQILKARNASTRAAFLSAPIYDDAGSTIGAIALVMAPIEPDAVQPLLATLEAVMTLASVCAERVSASPNGRDRAAGQIRDGRAFAGALSRVGRATTPEEIAFSITNELCNKLGCEQTALGMVCGRRVRVLSISGLDHVNHRNPGVSVIAAAMEECLDARESTGFQRTSAVLGEEFPGVYHLHKQWHAATKGDAVASIPLCVNESIVAVLSLRARNDQPFTREKLDRIRQTVEPYAPGLVLAERAARTIAGHARDALAETLELVRAPGLHMRKVLAVAVVVSAATFLLGTMPYQLHVPCVIRPAQIRHIAVPVDATLVESRVVEGDRVRAGDVLCAFDQRDALQEVERLAAERSVLELEVDRAVAEGKPVEARLALAKRRLVEARLDIAERRAERMIIRAPFDGVVVAGDLRHRVGENLAQGEPLLQIAPLVEWRLELSIPQSAAAFVTSDSRGVFLTYARPDESCRLRVTRAPTSAKAGEGETVFTGEATLAAAQPWLRPGMEGVARIDVGPRPVWWVATHGLIDYLRINLWL